MGISISSYDFLCQILLNCCTLAYPLVRSFIPVVTMLNRLFSFSSSANLSPCLQELRRALGYTNKAIKGRFKPRCKLDGSYEEMQCLVFGVRNETCWCVDSDGKELIGTRVPGKASCVPEMGRQIFLLQKYTDISYTLITLDQAEQGHLKSACVDLGLNIYHSFCIGDTGDTVTEAYLYIFAEWQ